MLKKCILKHTYTQHHESLGKYKLKAQWHKSMKRALKKLTIPSASKDENQLKLTYVEHGNTNR